MAKRGKIQSLRDAATSRASRPVKPSKPTKTGASEVAIATTVPSPSAIRKLGAASHLKTVREGMRNLEGNYRQRLRLELAKAYSTAVLLRGDQDEWLSFCKEEEWRTFRRRPKDGDRNDALRFAIRFAVGFGSDPESKRAANKRVDKFLGALKRYFDQKVPPHEIPDRLERDGGIEAIKAANAQDRQAQATDVDNNMLTIKVPLNRKAIRLLACRYPSRVKATLALKSCEGHLILGDFLHVSQLLQEKEAAEPVVIPHLHGAGGTNSTKPARRPHRLNKPTGKKRVEATAPRIPLKHELRAIQAQRAQE